VTVELDVSANEFSLLVRDDGVGLPVPTTPAALAAWTRSGHFGLLGMTERAACVGGLVTLDRPREGGTEVRLALPLPSVALPAPPTSQEEAAHA
jgi:signal transduction histidine kinase